MAVTDAHSIGLIVYGVVAALSFLVFLFSVFTTRSERRRQTNPIPRTNDDGTVVGHKMPVGLWLQTLGLFTMSSTVLFLASLLIWFGLGVGPNGVYLTWVAYALVGILFSAWMIVILGWDTAVAFLAGFSILVAFGSFTASMFVLTTEQLWSLGSVAFFMLVMFALFHLWSDFAMRRSSVWIIVWIVITVIGYAVTWVVSPGVTGGVSVTSEQWMHFAFTVFGPILGGIVLVWATSPYRGWWKSANIYSYNRIPQNAPVQSGNDLLSSMRGRKE